MKYFLKIYGCQYNEWDGARIDYMLQRIGLVPASEEEAELIFVLSCSVRQTANDRILGKIREWKKKKVIVTGCMLKKEKKMYEEKGALVWDLKNPEELKVILDLDPDSSITERLNEGSSNSAYLPIMAGCNNFCSYCAVPYTRGREQSRPMEDIVKDFQRLVKKGTKEIILLGQNVNSYKNPSPSVISSHSEPTVGWTEEGEKSHHNKKTDFAILLETLNEIDGNFIIAFTSNHPKDMTDDVIEAISTLPKVQKRIHLPLQSGSNMILKAMNRPYTKEHYLDLITKIKKTIPDIEITTDAIVGFPGETEDDFQETVEVYEKVGFLQSFTNKYSPRSGTVAFKLGDPISWQEKQRRWRMLNEIANKKLSLKNKSK